MTIWGTVAGLIAGRKDTDGKLGDFAISDDERTLLNMIYQLSQGNTEALINRKDVLLAARFESYFGERLLRALQREHLISYVPIGCLCITEAGIVCASSGWSSGQSVPDCARPDLATLDSSEIPPPEVDEDSFQQWLAARGLLHEPLTPAQILDLRRQFAGEA